MSLRSFYLRKKFWFNDWLHGANMWRQYRDIMWMLRDKDGAADRKSEMLRGIIAFAKKNTVFYSSIKGDDLFDFPVINKQTILSRYEDFTVDRSHIPGQIGEIHVQRTSGSTGTPFEIRQNTTCRTRRIALIKGANELIGFHSFDHLMHLRAVKHYWKDAYDITWRKDLNILYVDNANLTDEKVGRIVRAISNYEIRFIRGYMTTLDTITRYIEDNGIEINKDIVFISVGELLLESLRKRVVEELGCRIVSQYGNEENGVLGQSEINGPGNEIIFYGTNCFIEVLKLGSDQPADDGELGRIVVTDYTNLAMPMIRYDIGDLAKVGGRLLNGEISKIKDLAGRKTDLIFRTDGTVIDLFNSISPEIYNNKDISQWQFMQMGEKTYKLIISSKSSELREDQDHFSFLMKEILGDDARIVVEFTDSIPVLNSGKRRIVVNNFKMKNHKEEVK